MALSEHALQPERFPVTSQTDLSKVALSEHALQPQRFPVTSHTDLSKVALSEHALQPERLPGMLPAPPPSHRVVGLPAEDQRVTKTGDYRTAVVRTGVMNEGTV